jgi:mannose-1-phosphate guanylyltransferase
VKNPNPKNSTNNINAGIYVLEPTILDIIPQGENYSFEYSVFPDILAHEKPFYAFVMKDNYWRDLGTPKSYLDAHHDFLRGKIKNFEIEKMNNADVSHTAVVDETSLIGENCVIKPNARIINSVIGEGVHIEEKAIIENSVIWAHTRISSQAQVKNAVIGRSCFIGKNVSISEGAVLGDKTSLTDYTKV